jgi:hypothetical protein
LMDVASRRPTGCGCIGHPAFPTPSMGERFLQGPGRNASRQCEHTSGRHRERERSIPSTNSTDAVFPDCASLHPDDRRKFRSESRNIRALMSPECRIALLRHGGACH